MSGELAGLVLAAGAGTRLRPLTDLLAKPLCPVGNVALLDLALARVAAALGGGSARSVPAVAVNVSHQREQIEAHLDQLEHLHATTPFTATSAGGRALGGTVLGGTVLGGTVLGGMVLRRSIEPVALGTAGAVGPLRRWLDGRGLLIVNADTWCPASLRPLVQGWDGRSITVAVSGPPLLQDRSGIVASILPWSELVHVPEDPEPCGLWERFWRQALAEDRMVAVGVDGPFVDCGTPADYLRANLAAAELATAEPATPPAVGDQPSGAASARAGSAQRSLPGCLIDPTAVIAPTAVLRRSVVGAGAMVAGNLDRSVVWAGGRVTVGEDLVGCIRTGPDVTVQVDVAAS